MMIACIFLFIISLLISSIVPNIIREFVPFFMIAVIIIISSFKIDDKRKYIITFIFGVLYDLFYTNLVVFHGFIFVIILLFSKLIIKASKNFFKMIFTFYLMVFCYSVLMYLFSFLYTNLNLLTLINTIIKSFLINSVFFILIYILFIGIKCLISNRRKTLTY